MKEFEEKSISKDDPEFSLWSVKSKATETEVKVAEKMLLAYSSAETEVGAKIEDNKANGRNWYEGVPENSGILAENYFMESLTESEASMPFTRMLMAFGPILHWNDIVDVCFWTLGLSTENGWKDWFEYKNQNGL